MKSITLFAICLLLSISAIAQTKTDITRKGIVFGFSPGIANSNLKFPSKVQNNTNLALNWKIGYMRNPKLALLLNGAVSIYEYNLSDRKRLRDFGGVFCFFSIFCFRKIVDIRWCWPWH